MAECPQLTVRSRAQWRSWLGVNHHHVPGVWLVRFKKGKGPQVRFDEVVERKRSRSDGSTPNRAAWMTSNTAPHHPRKKGSRWSHANEERVARLRAQGLMSAAGDAAVHRSKIDGTWDALNQVEALEAPDGLRRALDAQPVARDNWNAFPRSTRRAILEWIHAAKRPETRARRIADTVEKASLNIRVDQWRQPDSGCDGAGRSEAHHRAPQFLIRASASAGAIASPLSSPPTEGGDR